MLCVANQFWIWILHLKPNLILPPVPFRRAKQAIDMQVKVCCELGIRSSRWNSQQQQRLDNLFHYGMHDVVFYGGVEDKKKLSAVRELNGMT